jgi:hypothetical protein
MCSSGALTLACLRLPFGFSRRIISIVRSNKSPASSARLRQRSGRLRTTRRSIIDASGCHSPASLPHVFHRPKLLGGVSSAKTGVTVSFVGKNGEIRSRRAYPPWDRYHPSRDPQLPSCGIAARLKSGRLWHGQGRGNHHHEKDDQWKRNQEPFVSGHQRSPNSKIGDAIRE